MARRADAYHARALRMSTPRTPKLRAVRTPPPIYLLRIELRDIEPTIWRSILVPGTIKLSKLHVVLQWTMGWVGGHLHLFFINDIEYGVPDPDFEQYPPVEREDRITLARALGARKTFTYLYDFGDSWEHRIKVQNILPPDPTLTTPFCLDGANACPPEDVGGVPGYIDFRHAISDPAHEEHQQMLNWCGGAFDPTAFDISEVNERLQQIKL